jgi:hypothetical protein
MNIGNIICGLVGFIFGTLIETIFFNFYKKKR